MKRYVIKPGEKGVDALHVQELTSRQLAPREVGVRVQAASLNCRDLITVNIGVGRELVPLSDGSGVVEEVGDDVAYLKKGDRLFKFDQVKDAYAFMQSARHFGKIVIELT